MYKAVRVASGGALVARETSTHLALAPHLYEVLCETRQAPYTPDDAEAYYETVDARTAKPRKQTTAVAALPLLVKFRFLRDVASYANSPTRSARDLVVSTYGMHLASLQSVNAEENESAPLPADAFKDTFMTVYRDMEKHHQEWVREGQHLYAMTRAEERAALQLGVCWFVLTMLVCVYVTDIPISTAPPGQAARGAALRFIFSAPFLAALFCIWGQLLQLQKILWSRPLDPFAQAQMRRKRVWLARVVVVGTLACELVILNI